MTRYDTSGQAASRREHRRWNIVAAIALFGFGAYVLGSYIYAALSPYPQPTTFGMILGIGIICLGFLPLSQAYIRRPHPETVEVREDAFVLRYQEGPPRRISWEDRPVSFAYDLRKVSGRHRRPEGMDVHLYVPVPGKREETTAFRPEEVHVSGKAFDEVKARMQKAGFRAVARRWSRGRPGQLVEFLAPGEEPGEPMPEMRARMWSTGAPGRRVDAAEAADDEGPESGASEQLPAETA